MPVAATLISVTSFSQGGTQPWNGSLDTSTWAFDTTSGTAVQTGGTWACIEGNLGQAIDVAICGNCNFGANFTNQSTYTPTATGGTVTLGGDDGAIGPPQTLVNQYSSMVATSLGGGDYSLKNASATSGYEFKFQTVFTVPPPSGSSAPPSA